MGVTKQQQWRGRIFSRQLAADFGMEEMAGEILLHIDDAGLDTWLVWSPIECQNSSTLVNCRRKDPVQAEMEGCSSS